MYIDTNLVNRKGSINITFFKTSLMYNSHEIEKDSVQKRDIVVAEIIPGGLLLLK